MTDELNECKERLAELEEENADLRKSSRAFGDLAERLNDELNDERRSGSDRRIEVRPAPDRRRSPVALTGR